MFSWLYTSSRFLAGLHFLALGRGFLRYRNPRRKRRMVGLLLDGLRQA